MRPIRLEVTGFTAFREKCEIDFSKLDLFAITGPTGAGKTSLLDAMTYALYGETSRLNKAGTDLVSQGAKNMTVLLHFRVGAEEYQVLRTVRGSTPSARLEGRENGEWKALTGGITAVNNQIQRIVGLDFGGFTKTVILPQGKFDLFLRGAPKERREVLSELLDVAVYQRMMKSANEKSKNAGIRMEERAATIDAAATPEAKAERERQCGELSAQEKVAATLWDKLRKSLPEALALRGKRTSLVTSHGELADTGVKIAKALDAASKARDQMEAQTAAILSVDREIESTPYDGDAHVRLSALLPQAQQQRKLSNQLADDLKERQRRKDILLAEEKVALEARDLLDAASAQLKKADGLRGSADSAFRDLRARHGSADAIQQAIEDLESARKGTAGVAAFGEQIRQLDARDAALIAEMEAANRTIEQARSDLLGAEKAYEQLHARDRGSALRHELKPGEPCPVCEQTVHKVPAAPEAGKLVKARGRVSQAKTDLQKAEARLIELRGEAQAIPGKRELAKEQIEMRQAGAEQAAARASGILGAPTEDAAPPLRALVKRIKVSELDAQQTRDRYESLLKRHGEADITLKNAEHKKQLTEAGISNIKDQIESSERQLEQLEEVLRGVPSPEEITKQISLLDAAKKTRDMLEAKRKDLQAKLQKAEKAVADCRQSSVVLAAEKLNSEGTIQALQKEIAKLEKQLKKALGTIALAETPDEAAQIERMEASSRKELKRLEGEVHQCEFQIKDLAKRIDHNDKLVKEVAQLQNESALYRDLGTWLNAGNFQTYLLGSAFDTLAKEGSKHLKELSGGRYEFAFEGDEFIVNDYSNGGEARSVKTLSGGESFLASLALALALAESITQLNGERGAVNLESLFLDEGFSTLDSDTLSKVADALEVLQNGKRLIGIITHVQALADQMPAQIEIEKSVTGSRIAQKSQSTAAARG